MMSLPLGMVCIKCGSVIGSIISSNADQLPKLEIACAHCIGAASRKTGVVPSSEENWQTVIAELKGLQ